MTKKRSLLRIVRDTIRLLQSAVTGFYVERTEDCPRTEKTIGVPGCPGIAPRKPPEAG